MINLVALKEIFVEEFVDAEFEVTFHGTFYHGEYLVGVIMDRIGTHLYFDSKLYQF